MTIHDHFDGSGHCVECNGACSLTGDERAVTEYVRWTLETLVFHGWTCLPSFWEEALRKLGKDPAYILRRAVETNALRRYEMKEDNPARR